jgi:hypothetical protein
MPTTTYPPPRRDREPLLDLWRGLALIDMAWVHLASYPIGMPDTAAAWIGHHTRFAAGCFVLLSGLTVCRAFGAGLKAGGPPRRAATIRLLRRAALLLLVDRLCGVAYEVIEQLVVDPSPIPALSLNGIVQIATFQRPGVTGGLLTLYSVLLAVTPVLDRLRAMAGAAAVGAGSLTVFTAAHVLGPITHWPPWTFPIAHWQPLFVAGYLASPVLERFRHSRAPLPSWWLATTTVAAAAMFAARSGANIGLPDAMIPAWDFGKVPLQPAELGWYTFASLFVLTWSAKLYGDGAASSRLVSWVCRLGRWSLVVYVSQLLLELPIIAFVTLVDPAPLLRAGMLLLMAAGMSTTAWIAEGVAARRRGQVGPLAAAMRLRLLPTGGAVGGGVAVASAMLVLGMQASIPARPHDSDYSADGNALTELTAAADDDAEGSWLLSDLVEYSRIEDEYDAGFTDQSGPTAPEPEPDASPDEFERTRPGN